MCGPTGRRSRPARLRNPTSAIGCTARSCAFKGSAEIDIAEIHGVFDGNLTVRQKLVIYATGRVTGKIRYGKVVIEEGGQLSGDIECSVNAATSKSSSSTSSTGMPAMALAA